MVIVSCPVAFTLMMSKVIYHSFLQRNPPIEDNVQDADATLLVVCFVLIAYLLSTICDKLLMSINTCLNTFIDFLSASFSTMSKTVKNQHQSSSSTNTAKQAIKTPIVQTGFVVETMSKKKHLILNDNLSSIVQMAALLDYYLTHPYAIENGLIDEVRETRSLIDVAFDAILIEALSEHNVKPDEVVALNIYLARNQTNLDRFIKSTL